jgi:hypothetical protein
MAKAILFCVCLIASAFQVAGACSCRPEVTLAQKYQQADHILIAKISGCAPDRLSSEGVCRNHGWSFDTLENLKGSDAQVRALPSDASQAVNTCDLALTVGETYLLFLKDGRSYQCSGTGNLSGDSGARRRSDVEILRAYRDGAMSSIIDPWHFWDGGWQCTIDHLLDGGVHASFSYAYTPPPLRPQDQGALMKPMPTFTLRLSGSFDFVGTTAFEVNGDSVSLTRKAVRLPDGRTFSLELMQGDTVLDLLNTLSRPTELVVSGHRSASGREPEAFRATTNTSRIAEAAAKFRACVARDRERVHD